MVSNLDCTGQKGEVWGEKEELGDEGGSWRVFLFPLSMETKAGFSVNLNVLAVFSPMVRRG